MKPSIGRIVHASWYNQRVPAIITHIWSDDCVNVSLLAPLEVNPELSFGHTIKSSIYQQESPESAAQPNRTDISHASWTWPPRTP